MMDGFINIIKKIIKDFALRRGYLIISVPGSYIKDLGYALPGYLSKDGVFDYEAYRRVQTEGNKRKICKVWAIEDNIKFLAEYIKEKVGKPQFGLCHGVRRGLEQKWFSESLGIEVLGTEISDTATEFSNTIQWDFHDVKEEWKENVDFIYSNSFDHSYDPEKCLNAWMSCIKPGGVCILEHSPRHGLGSVTELDPFGAELFQMPYLITKWGKGRYVVREILGAPVKSDYVSCLYFIIIQHFPEK